MEIRFRALLASDHHHQKVNRFTRVRLVSSRHDRVNHHYASSPRGCIAASSKNGLANVIIPIVDDSLKHVSVAARRYGFEEVAGGDVTGRSENLVPTKL
jgi:hypothetical protein